ncbi:hypothetical protein Cantr_07183 [Candida viswanathii]|uniref:SUN domain-containing protein n=1 Tax=Candida viswanathii TaxID=5486 RepID=A0A367XYT3_9ASCO|nr:hypothetical protein Cantr_07183 [Candida viswanathii]
MNGFPQVPRFRGDTDEDASIHLNHTVGKAKPLRPSNYYGLPNSSVSIDDKISSVLREGEGEEEEEEEIDEDYINETYMKFLNDEFDDEADDNDYEYEYEGGSDSDTYRDEGGIRSDGSISEDLSRSHLDDHSYVSLLDRLDKPNGTTERRSPFHEKSVFNDTEYHDAVGEDHSEDDRYSSDEDTPVVIESIKRAKSQMPNPDNNNKKASFNWKLAIVISIVSFLMTSIGYLLINGDRITLPELNFPESIRLAKLDGRLHRLEQDLKKSRSDQQDVLLQVQYEINQLNERLSRGLETGGKSNDIIQLNNNMIQVTPEFHQFLCEFIDNYQKSYLDEKLGSLENLSDIKELKEYVNTMIKSSVDSIKQEVKADYDGLLDNLTFVNSTIVEPSSNKIWVDSVLNLISRGSTLVNYADYSSGARILGFLTTPKEDATTDYNVLQKMIYGWWIYNERITQHDKYNANHVILDDDILWQGGDEIGIRLSSGIIPTDIIIECELERSQLVEVGFKPSTKSGYDKLNYGKVNSSDNKYITKFKLIKQAKIKSGINHIRLPIRFINQKIAGRDLYFKFDKDLDINSIKVYGITEINAIKYQDKLSLLVENFNEAISEKSNDEYHHYRGGTQQREDRHNNGNHITQIDLNEDIYL